MTYELNANKKPYILQICGLKNTGKTTFVKELTAYLHEKNYRVAVIKHDGHDFDTKHYKEDNFQHYQAGAQASVVFSKTQWMRVQKEERSLEQFIEEFQEMDFILIEGCKQASYPKVELLRKGISETPVSNKQGRFACIVDGDYTIDERCFYREEEELYENVIRSLIEMQ